MDLRRQRQGMIQTKVSFLWNKHLFMKCKDIFRERVKFISYYIQRDFSFYLSEDHFSNSSNSSLIKKIISRLKVYMNSCHVWYVRIIERLSTHKYNLCVCS